VTRVFIVGRSPLGRRGLESLLESRAVEVVGSAASLESAGATVSHAEAGILLIDATGEQPERLVQAVAESGVTSEFAVLILAEHFPGAAAAAAVGAGVRGVLPNDLMPDQLVAAIEAAASGLIVVHPADVAAVAPASMPASRALAELAEPLTKREREVLQMLAAGVGNKEIAARLAISEHTVKFHVTSILGKLGAGSRTEAVSLGIRRGLVLL